MIQLMLDLILLFPESLCDLGGGELEDDRTHEMV